MKSCTVHRVGWSLVLVAALAAPARAETGQTPQDEATFTPAPIRVTFADDPADQTPAPSPSGSRHPYLAVKFSFEHFTSDSLKAGEVNVCLPIGAEHRKGIFNPCLVGEFDLGRVTMTTVFQVLGGVRFEDADNPNVTFFGEVDGGATHFAAETDFTLKFGGGVMVPLHKKRMNLVVQFFMPIIMFPGSSETGLQVGGGVTIPLRGSR